MQTISKDEAERVARINYWMTFAEKYAAEDELSKRDAMLKRRRELERDEGWDSICQRLWQIPALNFKPGWRVRVLPPFMGAVARFIVETDHGSVSVYLDFHGNLCGWGGRNSTPEPYWEAYKDEEASNVRFKLEDTAGLIAFIASQVEPDYRPATSTVVSSTTGPNGFSFVINVPAGGAQ
ncbi:hypothetical protein ACGYU5_15305 [Burkholderia pseudomallei]